LDRGGLGGICDVNEKQEPQKKGSDTAVGGGEPLVKERAHVKKATFTEGEIQINNVKGISHPCRLI